MARLDTGWHANPKVLGLGLQAMGLHAWSISYCDSTRSDGFIPHGAWPSLPGVGSAVKRLLDAGMWVRCDDGFMLHDYLEYNHSREEIEEYMRAKRAAGQQGGLAKAKARARANGVANGQHEPYQKATPGPGPGTSLQDVPLSPTPSPPENTDADGADGAAPRAAAQECPICSRSFIGPYAEHQCDPLRRPKRLPGLGRLLPREAREPPPPEALAELEMLERTRADRQAEAQRLANEA